MEGSGVYIWAVGWWNFINFIYWEIFWWSSKWSFMFLIGKLSANCLHLSERWNVSDTRSISISSSASSPPTLTGCWAMLCRWVLWHVTQCDTLWQSVANCDNLWQSVMQCDIVWQKLRLSLTQFLLKRKKWKSLQVRKELGMEVASVWAELSISSCLLIPKKFPAAKACYNGFEKVPPEWGDAKFAKLANIRFNENACFGISHLVPSLETKLQQLVDNRGRLF